MAVIIGSGTGGLVAATALAPFFQQVIILEKDKLPNNPQPRKGVPQGAHLHSLLLGGLEILEFFYSGITHDLLNKGAVKLRAGLDQKIFETGQWLPERDLNLTILAQSRSLLESVISTRTTDIKNINVIQQARVQEITLDQEQNINGINYTNQAGEVTSLASNTVIDASGLGGFFVKQLANTFTDITRTEVLQSNIAYSTAFVKKPENWLSHKENILIMPEPTHSAGGALIDIENDTWCISLHGRNGIIPPTNFEEWKVFAKEQLPNAAIWERVKDAELKQKITIFRKPTSTWRRFDLVERMPQGYYPLGDTISSVNPIFGQGMTVAFGHAKSLHEAFTSNPEPQAAYLKKAAAFSEKAWRRVLAYDSMFAKNDEKQPRNYSIMRKLALARQQQAYNDAEIHRNIIMQGQMLSS